MEKTTLCIKFNSKSMRPFFLVTAAAAVSIVLLSLYFLWTTPKSDVVILTINGEPVTKAEFTLVMSDMRSDVFTYFSQKYYVSDSPAFWTSRFGNEVPLQVLKQKTVVQLRNVRAVSDLAKANGISAPSSYRTFLKSWDAENRRRKDAAGKEGAVYGPVFLSVIEYYQYLYGNEMESTKNKLENGLLSVTDSQIDAYYQQNRNTSYRNQNGSYILLADVRTQIVHKLQDQKYSALIQGLVKKQSVILGKGYDRISEKDCA